MPLYRNTAEFFPLSRESAIRASGFSTATGYRYDVQDLPAEVWRKLPESFMRRTPAGLVAQPEAKGQDSHWRDRLWRMLYAAETERLSHDELASEFGFEVSIVPVLLKRARELRDIPDPSSATEWLHAMTWWSPDRRQPKKVRLCCPYRPQAAQDRRIMDRFELPFSGAILQGFPKAAQMDRARQLARVERALEYFIRHQKGIGPLIFRSPEHATEAQDYLHLLEIFEIQRLSIKKKGSDEVSVPSEIRFVSYDPAKRSHFVQRWREALPLKSRDVIETCIDGGSPQRLGILAHFQVAPEKPFVGSAGFRFLMLMAWIAFPWLTKTTE